MMLKEKIADEIIEFVIAKVKEHYDEKEEAA